MVSERCLCRLQVWLEVKCNRYDDLVSYPQIANLDLGGIVSLAVRADLTIFESRLVR
jgi:hypothetical protein